MATPDQVKLTSVGLFSFNVESGSYDKQATIRLKDDGSVSFEGAPVLVERLRGQAIPTSGGAVLPEDGPAYLAALIERYTDPHLKAMPLKPQA